MELARNALRADSELKAYYVLEDNTASVGSNLTEVGTVSYSAGKFGNGADLGTGSNCLYVNSVYSTTYNADKSLSIWVNPNAQPSTNDWNTFITIGYATGDVYYYVAYQDSGGTKRLRFTRDRYNVTNENVYYNVTLSNGTWYHIVMTFSGTTIRGYLNGSKVAQGTVSTSSGNNGATDRLVLGSILDVNGRFAKAKLDDGAFFNKLLSDTEVSNLYKSRNFGAGIIAHI